MDGHKPFIAAEEHRDARDAARTGPVVDVSPLDSSDLMMQRVEALRELVEALRERVELAEAAAVNWAARADEQGARAEAAEAEVADYRDLHLPAASDGIVCVARRWRDLTLEAERRNAEILQRADLAEARLAALESAIIDGNSGEWYGSAQHVEGRSDWPTLTALADATIAAQQPAQKEGGAQ